MSLKGMQTQTRALRALTFNAGQPDNINLGEQLPTTIFGRIAHLVGIFFRVNFSAYTAAAAAPSIVQLNNIVATMTFKDGFNTRFSGGGFNLLRTLEMLEHGRLVEPDPPNNGAGPLAAFGRYLPLGVPNFAGDPSDFLLPCAALKNATFDLSYGSLADIAASAATATIQPIAVLAALDKELRIPPVVERSVWPLASKKSTIQGRALYANMGLLNSLSYDAIATGDFASFSLLTGAGDTSPAELSAVEKLFHYQMRAGQLSQVHGEPLSAQDVNPRALNPATPTAWQAADSIVAPIIWSPPGSRISKMLYGSEGSVAVDWTGTQAGSYAVGTRIVAQPREAAGALAAVALDKLGVKMAGMGIKTLTKDDYRGPRADFMPWKVKVA